MTCPDSIIRPDYLTTSSRSPTQCLMSSTSTAPSLTPSLPPPRPNLILHQQLQTHRSRLGHRPRPSRGERGQRGHRWSGDATSVERVSERVRLESGLLIKRVRVSSNMVQVKLEPTRVFIGYTCPSPIWIHGYRIGYQARLIGFDTGQVRV